MKARRDTARREWRERVQRTGTGRNGLPRRLEEAGAAGVISSQWSSGWGARRIFSARTERVPTFDLGCEDYGLVFRLAKHDQNPVLEVEAEAEWLGEVPVFNTIAEIRGSQKPDEYVLLSAHLDSWDGGSGATDDGTGTIVMLEAMRIIRAAYPWRITRRWWTACTRSSTRTTAPAGL
jgi:acetylornithine deacetylase/succinyl-diaminopimelate desuccinylase-like protein